MSRKAREYSFRSQTDLHRGRCADSLPENTEEFCVYGHNDRADGHERRPEGRTEENPVMGEDARREGNGEALYPVAHARF